NGLGNAETIARTARRVVAGTTAHGVTFVGPGEIRHAGVGETMIGAWSRVSESDLVRLRDLLADVGIVASVTSDIRTELWSKLIVNASINPIAALAEVPNGRIVRDKRLLGVLEAVCREATAVAKAEGAGVAEEELRHRTILVAKRTAANRASMLQDLDRHHRTEIDAIPGAHLPIKGAEDRDAPLPKRESRLHRGEEPRARQDRDRHGREADRGGRNPDQKESGDRGPEHRCILRPRNGNQPERHRDIARPREGGVRARAIPRSRVSNRRTEGGRPPVRQRQARVHG